MDGAASLDGKPITSVDNVGGALAPATPQLAHLRHHIEAWLADDATPAEQRPGLAHALAMIDRELADRLATLVYIDDEVAFGLALEETARACGIHRAAPAARSRVENINSTSVPPAKVTAIRGRRAPLGAGVRRAGR